MSDAPYYMMPLDKIEVDPRTQVRVAMDQVTIEDYAAAMQRGDEFPPIVVFGTKKAAYLASGHHRYAAADLAGRKKVAVILNDGDLDDAIWFSLASNKTNGLRLTIADKNRAVEIALRTNPEMSNILLAEHCGVSDTFVGNKRREMFPETDDDQIVRIGKGGRTIRTAKIGRRKAEPAPDVNQEPPEETAPDSGLCSNCQTYIPAGRIAHIVQCIAENEPTPAAAPSETVPLGVPDAAFEAVPLFADAGPSDDPETPEALSATTAPVITPAEAYDTLAWLPSILNLSPSSVAALSANPEGDWHVGYAAREWLLGYREALMERRLVLQGAATAEAVMYDDVSAQAVEEPEATTETPPVEA